MKHLFLPYELAKIAKEKGFNEPCIAWYSAGNLIPLGQSIYVLDGLKSKSNLDEPFSWPDNQAAPLYQQIVDWFRDKHMVKFIEEENFITQGFTGTPLFCIKKAGSGKTEPFPINKAIEEAFKLI